MRRLGLLLLLATGCGRGSALAGACADDSACPPGMHCVKGTGVCVKFGTPLRSSDAGSAADARD